MGMDAIERVVKKARGEIDADDHAINDDPESPETQKHSAKGMGEHHS